VLYEENNSMNEVWVVQHSYDLDGCEETKFIGVYSSKRKAHDAVARLRKQPGGISL